LELITRAKLAERVGVTRQAIGDAVKNGRLRLVGEGRAAKIDLHDSLTKDYIFNTNAQRKEKAPERSQQPQGTQKPLPGDSRPVREIKMPPAISEDLPGATQLPRLEDMTDEQMRALSRTDLDRLEGIEKIRDKKIKNDQARNVLIARSFVAHHMSKVFQVDSTELLTLPTRLSPDIASLTKTDKPDTILEIERLIEEQIFRSLNHKKKIINEFLEQVEAELIAD
jgi:hypothetical protein